MSLKAVAVNGALLPECTNHVAIEPGDEVTAEIFLSDWGDEIGAVTIYAATVLGDEGGESGETGSLVPSAWPTPGWAMDVQRPDFIHAGRLPCTCPQDVGCIVEFCRFWTWESDLFFSAGTTDPGDGTEFYGGALNLVASDDACGRFTFEFDLTNSYLQDTLGQVAGITAEPLVIDVACLPVVIGACPDNCAIDARYPHDPANNALSLLWDEVNVRFGWTGASTLVCSDFVITFVGGRPVLMGCFFVKPIRADTVEVGYTRAIPTARWTCLGLIGGRPGADQICLASLPGDVNADRVSDGGDVLSLVDLVYAGETLKPWQCDIDRDGACTHLDLLGLVDVLVGANEFIPWAGASISVPCPSAALTATCGDVSEP